MNHRVRHMEILSPTQLWLQPCLWPRNEQDFFRDNEFTMEPAEAMCEALFTEHPLTPRSLADTAWDQCDRPIWPYFHTWLREGHDWEWISAVWTALHEDHHCADWHYEHGIFYTKSSA